MHHDASLRYLLRVGLVLRVRWAVGASGREILERVEGYTGLLSERGDLVISFNGEPDGDGDWRVMLCFVLVWIVGVSKRV